MADSLKIIFAGTPEFAQMALAALLASRHEVIAIYTQPDRPAGRGRKLAASPVKQLALEHGLPVMQPASLKPEEQHEVLPTNSECNYFSPTLCNNAMFGGRIAPTGNPHTITT